MRAQPICRPDQSRCRNEEGDHPIRVNLRASAVGLCVLCVSVVEFVFYGFDDDFLIEKEPFVLHFEADRG